MELLHGGRHVLLGTAAALVLVLAGCAAAPTPADSASPDAAVLGLTGPWADDFAAAMAITGSDYERAVLADGVVTSAEIADAHERVGSCLGDSGYTISYFAEGGFEIGSAKGDPPSNDMERTNAVLETCEAEFDQSITQLYQETQRNPDKQDEAKIAVACLRRAGLVGTDYSLRNWRSEYDRDAYSFDDDDPAAVACRLDPLGLWRMR